MRAFSFALVLVLGCPQRAEVPDAALDGALPDASTDSSLSHDATADAIVDAAFVDAPAADATVRSLRIATWNVENFFDAVDDPARSDEVVSSEQVAAKITGIVAVLRSVNADVVAFQEVENIGLLRQLAAAAPDLGYDHHALVDAYDPRGIDVGLLSRRPIISTSSHLGELFTSPVTGDRYRFARDALEVELEGGIRVIVVHFISQIGDTDDKRLAEATRVRSIAEMHVAAGDNLVLLGDFNDVPTSPPLRTMSESTALRDVTLAVPVEQRWTYFYRGEQQIDYIFASPSLAMSAASVRIGHDTPFAGVSDHRPLSADVSW